MDKKADNKTGVGMRDLIVNAIVAKYRGSEHDEALIRAELRKISSDSSLIAFAIQVGIDTDKVISGGSR